MTTEQLKDIAQWTAIIANATTVLGIIAAVWVGVLGWKQLRDVRVSRQVDLFARVYEHLMTQQFGEAIWSMQQLEFNSYEDFITKYPIGSPEWFHRREVMNFVEFLGWLCKNEFIPSDLVIEYLRDMPALFVKFKPFVDGYRARFGPDYMAGFEWLHDTWRQKAVKHGWADLAESVWATPGGASKEVHDTSVSRESAHHEEESST